MSGSFPGMDGQELQRKVDDLTAFLKQKITEDPECLKRRYLWLAPAVLKHSKTVVDLLCCKLALCEPQATSDKEKDILLFETFIASYSIAMHTADQIVKNKTRYKENACRRISEEPLGITLHICEELFDSLGHEFKTIFDIYASYQYLDLTHGKHSPEDIAASDVPNDISARMKMFFNIDVNSYSVSDHLTDRIIKRIPRFSKKLIGDFVHRFVIVPSQMLPLDGFHAEQDQIDEIVRQFLELV